MTESIIATSTADGTTTIYVERDMGITTDKPALLGELVRCRDCVNLKRVRATGVFGKGPNCVMGEHYVRPDDYCAWVYRMRDAVAGRPIRMRYLMALLN